MVSHTTETTLSGKTSIWLLVLEHTDTYRWLQEKRTSPLTGLPLINTDLRVNGEIANQVRDWITGENLTTVPTTSEIKRTTFVVKFFSRLGAFSRKIQSDVPMHNLHELAFRGMKGTYAEFELYSNNIRLDNSASPLSTIDLSNDTIIHINVPKETHAPLITSKARADATKLEELALIKVYSSQNENNV